MKLFKSLLIAPATLGLLAPIAATANEVTISDFTTTEQLAITNSRVDGLEARMNNIEAGGFSETTTATFGVNFYAGISDDDDPSGTPAADFDDNLMTGYDFTIGLTTSFTGEDSLDIAIDAGDGAAEGILEFGGDGNNGVLTVDEISYTFPLGDKTTVIVGDNLGASTLTTKACVYGTPSDTLDECGVPNGYVGNDGPMVGVAYDFGNGLTAAAGYAGENADFANEEGVDGYVLNMAYIADTYGASFTYGALEDDGAQGTVDDNMGVDTFFALNAYFDPATDGLPSISVGYENGEDASVDGNSDGITNFMVGATWDELGPGSFGIGMGTHVNTVEDTDAQYMYEAYYEYPINDGMTITPLIFTKDVSTANTDDTTGVMVKTSFAF